MRSRNRLHKSKLKEFESWLEGQGWSSKPPKGCYEVLRMRHPKFKEVLFVYDRIDAKEHYTTHGIADELLTKWLRELRHKQEG